jgi:RNA polymerase sigma factor (sigma-70 family)
MPLLPQEFVHIIQQHSKIIYKVCYLYCKNAEERKDLFQEIVLQVWKRLPGFRNDSSITTWMYRIALNTAISNYRKEKKHLREPLSEATFHLPDPDAWPDNEPVQILYKAIEQLTDVEKAIILLYLEEKTYDEIAFVVGITRTNVGVKITRIKTKLEKILNTLEYEHR